MRRIGAAGLARLIPGLLRNPLRTLSRVSAVASRMVLFKVGRYETYLLAHPDELRRVLQENPDGYDRGTLLGPLQPLIGKGLFSTDTEGWIAQRRLLNPAFRAEGDQEIAEVTRAALVRTMQKWEGSAGGTISVEHDLKMLCLDVLLEVMVAPGVEADRERIIRSLDTVLQSASYKGQVLRLIKAPWKGLRAVAGLHPDPVRDALQWLDSFIYGVIDQCRTGRLKPGRALAPLLEAVDAGTIPISQVRDDVATLLFAGFDTVAEMITWSLHLLAVHPETQVALRSSLSPSEGSAPAEPVKRDMQDQDLLQTVLHEALRLYPPAWAFFRSPIRDDQVGEETVSRGSAVMICPYTQHRHPALWDRPDEFRPERHREGLEPCAYVPFGFGRHRCIGRHMAMLEGRLIVSEIVRRFRIEARHSATPVVNPGIIIQSKRPLRFVFHPI